MKEQDHICNVNPVQVCLHVRQVDWAALYSAHTFNQDEGLGILISHFVISRYLGGEVCALECEASVCADVTTNSTGDFNFFCY